MLYHFRSVRLVFHRQNLGTVSRWGRGRLCGGPEPSRSEGPVSLCGRGLGRGASASGSQLGLPVSRPHKTAWFTVSCFSCIRLSLKSVWRLISILFLILTNIIQISCAKESGSGKLTDPRWRRRGSVFPHYALRTLSQRLAEHQHGASLACRLATSVPPISASVLPALSHHHPPEMGPKPPEQLPASPITFSMRDSMALRVTQ